MKYIIIDGYNLIFQCGLEGRSADGRALQRARERLFRELAAALRPNVRERTTIVFDSAKRPAGVDSDQFTHEKMKVVFAVDHDDADTLIGELIRKHPVPASLTVVSSDHQIQRRAKARRATAVDSDVWFDRVLEIAQRRDSKIPPDVQTEKNASGLLTDAETQALIEEFESIPASRSDASDTEQSESPDKPSSRDDAAERNPDKAQKESPFENEFNPFPPGWFDDLNL